MICAPLTAEAFAPFGDVVSAPVQPGRRYFDDALESTGVAARPSLSIAHRLPVASMPLQVTSLERHPFSSQTFLPLSGGRWIIVVCRSRDGDVPDVASACAFVAGPDQGVTYCRGVWHHPLTVLDVPGCHAVWMWRQNSGIDDEFVDVPSFSVELEPGGSAA